ncbi:hypothetical protein [Sphingopyxis granuli]|uniref:hypothetical protein n=1 Tax=Sphingopyxis granuli TaxID=267128 RepID=UPI000AD06839|nr:hypothetical protein [Sphingopyxis granuli]
MGVEDNGGLRGEKDRGGGSSLFVLAACALLLGGGWYWLEGGSDPAEPVAAPAAPEASPDQDAQPAMTGEAEGEGMPAGASSGSALFGGLGGTDVADNPAETAPMPSPSPSLPPPPSGAAPLFRQAMVGSWSRENKSCEAVSTMILGDDGTFVMGSEAAGDWKLMGNRLILQARSTRKSEGDLVVLEVEPLGNGRIRAKGPDGTISVLMKCPDF